MKILIIEDNKKLALGIKRGLEQESYVADYVLDGAAGERQIELNRDNYDLVILDIMLPEKDGITICRNWRKANIAIPVLMLTAKDAVEDKIGGLDCGADDYLTKPFLFDELTARIRALLRRPKETLPVELKVKDIVLNTATRKVTRAGEEFVLTFKEFMILEYFMRHSGRVVTRDQLYDHAWDFSADAFSNTVDVHIKNLRKKIDYNNNEKLLETVRGLGYRLRT